MRNVTLTAKGIPKYIYKGCSGIFRIDGLYYFLCHQERTIEVSTKKKSLRQLAFDNFLLATRTPAVSNGNAVITNGAASKVLGYSIAELFIRAAIFNINESSCKKMLKE
jgi:hypothetical protein